MASVERAAVRTAKDGACFLTLGGFAALLGLEFGQELVRGAALSGEVFLIAGVDMHTDLRGLEFEIVFKLIDVHYRVMKIDQC